MLEFVSPLWQSNLPEALQKPRISKLNKSADINKVNKNYAFEMIYILVWELRETGLSIKRHNLT